MLKNKLSLILYAIIAFNIYSCTSLKSKDALGKYIFETKISKGSLILNTNTFEYNYEAPMEAYTSKGTWFLEKNHIILKSDNFYLNDFMIVNETFSENKTIKILDENKTPIEGISVKINDINSLFVTNKSGVISLQNDIKIHKIKVEYFGLSNQLYKVKNNNATTFEISILPKDYTKIFFDNYHGKINNKEIKIYNQKYTKNK
ncbi:hypothetical protein [Flavobacterium microcysteis]|uniref:Uncharacterized protein n=1 Tax=Flavobacterium microcysteis TaxID=2596891 RepID=A0A501QNQ7_9FLAO|nr:hypothetical protein [Flavobacterium microcysteis]TPD73756.1 hypothetical protein FJA49_00230 [Flavobacterium microcysteis]